MAIALLVAAAACGGEPAGVPESALNGSWLLIRETVAQVGDPSVPGYIGDRSADPAAGDGDTLIEVVWVVEGEELVGRQTDDVVAAIPITSREDEHLQLDMSRARLGDAFAATQALAGGGVTTELLPFAPPPGSDDDEGRLKRYRAGCKDGAICPPLVARWSDAFGGGQVFAFDGMVREQLTTAAGASAERWSRVTFLKQPPVSEDEPGYVPAPADTLTGIANVFATNGHRLRHDLARRPTVLHIARSVPDQLLRPLLESAASWNEAYARARRLALGDAEPVYPAIDCQRADPDAWCYCVDDPMTGTPVNPTCAGSYDAFASPEQASAAGVTDPIRCYVSVSADADLTAEVTPTDFAPWRSATFEGDECFIVAQPVSCDEPACHAGLSAAFVVHADPAATRFVAATRIGAAPSSGEVVTASITLATAAITSLSDRAMANDGTALSPLVVPAAWRPGPVSPTLASTAVPFVLAARANVVALSELTEAAALERDEHYTRVEGSGVIAGLETVTVADERLRAQLASDPGSELASDRDRRKAALMAHTMELPFHLAFDPSLQAARAIVSTTGLGVLIERRLVRTAALEAIGHMLGLAPNPAASTDAAHYHPQFAHAVASQPLPATNGIDEATDAALLQVYAADYAAARARQRRAGADAAMTASVTDPSFAPLDRSPGTGAYDRMALAASYFEVEPSEAFALCTVAQMESSLDGRCIGGDRGASRRDIVEQTATLYEYVAAALSRDTGIGGTSGYQRVLLRLLAPAVHGARTMVATEVDTADVSAFGPVDGFFAWMDAVNLLARMALSPNSDERWLPDGTATFATGVDPAVMRPEATTATRIGSVQDASFAVRLLASRTLDRGREHQSAASNAELAGRAGFEVIDAVAGAGSGAGGLLVTCIDDPDCMDRRFAWADLLASSCPLDGTFCVPRQGSALPTGGVLAPTVAAVVGLVDAPLGHRRPLNRALFACERGNDCEVTNPALLEGTDFVYGIPSDRSRIFLAYRASPAGYQPRPSAAFSGARELTRLAELVRLLRVYRGDFEPGDPPPSVSYLTPAEQTWLGENGFALPALEPAIATAIVNAESRALDEERRLLDLVVLSHAAGGAR